MDPERLTLIGFMGAGKSTVGPRLGSRLGLAFVDLDGAVERRAGKRVAEIFEQDGEAVFRDLEAELLDELTSQDPPLVLATGGGVVERAANRTLMHSRSLVVWLDVHFETVRRRLAALDPRERPLVGRLGWEGLERLHHRRRPLYAECAHFRFDADRELPARLVRRILVSTRPLRDGASR